MASVVGKGRVARLFAAALLGIVVSAVLLAWLKPVQGSEATAALSAEFCTLAPAEAHAGPRDNAAVALHAVVPQASTESVDFDIKPISAMQGDVVRVAVDSPRDGGVAVHGLLDVRPIAANGSVSVEFRAIYSGRFPIHFHGADGSHIQIAAIEVSPASGRP